MKDQLTGLCEWLTMLLTTLADDLAHLRQFLRRQRSFSGAQFVRTLILGWIENSKATLEDFAEQLGVTAPALQQRMTPACVALMRGLLEKACACLLAAVPQEIGLTRRFPQILVEDCTSIPLPETFRAEFPGCGGAEPGQGVAGLKALLRIEVKTGAVSVLTWAAGRENDLSLSRQAGDPPAGSLYLADLGFWCPERLDRFTRQGISWISRVPAGTTLSTNGLPREDWAEFLKRQQGDRVDQPVLLGAKAFPFRLVAVRCPAEVAARRKRQLRKKANKQGRPVSARQLVLCEWLVRVTSLSAEEFSIEELWSLYRVRWQIELVFKRWKSLSGLDQSRARSNGHRRLVELYAKWLGCLVMHWCGLLRAGLLTKLSWYRILHQVKRSLSSLLTIWNDSSPQPGMEAMLKTLVNRLNQLKPRSKRKKKPGTIELLENPTLAL